ncbi:hypothetical protein ACFV9C_41865 [Kribbella sp. NPDC059898]|uniref:hypothetical protein n=1 Tax=Kribbella sp. NPDC059898 TaxID=3346995 RepID=UPI00364BD020
MLDKPTPPQGMMNGDDKPTGGNAVSLLNRGKNPAGTPGESDPSNRISRSSRGLKVWGGVVLGIVAVVALVVAGIVVLSGRSKNHGSTATSPSSEPTSAPSSPSLSSTPSKPAAPEQVATEGATTGYRRWTAVQIQVAQSGGTNAPQAQLAAVATGVQLTVDRYTADVYYKQRGRRLITPATIVSIKAASIGIRNTAGVITDVTLAVCEDVRKAYGVGKDGKSQVNPNRQPYLNDTVAMTLVGGSWKVKDSSNKPGRSCA